MISPNTHTWLAAVVAVAVGLAIGQQSTQFQVITLLAAAVLVVLIGEGGRWGLGVLSSIRLWIANRELPIWEILPLLLVSLIVGMFISVLVSGGLTELDRSLAPLLAAISAFFAVWLERRVQRERLDEAERVARRELDAHHKALGEMAQEDQWRDQRRGL